MPSCFVATDISANLRSDLDICYSQAAKLGLNQFQVFLTEVFNAGGDRPGHGGTRVRTDTRVCLLDGYNSMYPGDGYLNPTFRQVSQKEVALANGRLQDKDFCIGPLVL